MIAIRLGDIARSGAPAILRPIASDWSAVTPAMRRLDVAAGPEMSAQAERLGDLPVGSAVITGAGDLTSQFLVHVVVRSREEPVSPAGVRRALVNGLRRVREWGIDRVAVVPLGTGAGNLDAEEAAGVMLPVLLRAQGESSAGLEVEVWVESEYERLAFEAELERSTG